MYIHILLTLIDTVGYRVHQYADYEIYTTNTPPPHLTDDQVTPHPRTSAKNKCSHPRHRRSRIQWLQQLRKHYSSWGVVTVSDCSDSQLDSNWLHPVTDIAAILYRYEELRPLDANRRWNASDPRIADQGCSQWYTREMWAGDLGFRKNWF